jgi:lipoate-protein ligase A
MMYYISSSDTDPYSNLALEQVVFDRLDRSQDYFMLWQNHNSIIVGRHQNTISEINASFVREKGITVARRLSGGGAVYHDLGNLNFTFVMGIQESRSLPLTTYCIPIQKALAQFGVTVEITGRNDMTVDGKKFSGNAQYIKQGRVMHHGTILYDSDLGMISQALTVSQDKLESKGIKSINSRVTNIRPYMKTDMNITAFWEVLREYMFSAYDMKEYTLSAQEKTEAVQLRDTVYSQWNWNYGASPPFNLKKTRLVPGCGKIEILLDVAQEGIIKNIAFYGDFFGNTDPKELSEKLIGKHFEQNDIKSALAGIELSAYFLGMDTGAFLSILFE